MRRTAVLGGLRAIVACNMQAFRGEAGLTQQQLADLANVSSATVSKGERGEIMPTTDTIEKLAHVLGRKPSDFYAENPPPPPPRPELPNIMFKLAPGFELDEDLMRQGLEFIRKLDREQIDRVAKLKREQQENRRKKK
jgi:transcriptional regulator with XRE-family HTH domain